MLGREAQRAISQKGSAVVDDPGRLPIPVGIGGLSSKPAFMKSGLAMLGQKKFCYVIVVVVVVEVVVGA